MQRIVPNIWFDHTAAEAAAFYTSAFDAGRILHTEHYPTEGLLDFQADLAGDVLSVDFEVDGFRFTAINAGPEFPVNPSLSFTLSFPAADTEAAARLDGLWTALSEGGTVMIPLAGYDFSPRYGWVLDRYGVGWQFLTTPEPAPFIRPCLLFGNVAKGRTLEAVEHYTSVFGGRIDRVDRDADQDGADADGVRYAEFELLGQKFIALESHGEQDFTFSCGVSLLVECAGQEELDRYWGQLSAVPEAEQCGWCTDRFGVSWQLIPDNLAELMGTPDAFAKLMQMGKIEIAAFG